MKVGVELLPLWSVVAHARRSDPETSHQAAAGIRRLTARHGAVWRVLDSVDDATHEELVARYEDLCDRYDVNRWWVPQTAASIRSRCTELLAHGLVEYTGAKRPSANGRHPMRVFRVIDRERAERLFAEVER